MMIAAPSATTFLFGEVDHRETGGAKRARSNRGVATPTGTTAPKAPVHTHWVNRRAMKRAG